MVGPWILRGRGVALEGGTAPGRAVAGLDGAGRHAPGADGRARRCRERTRAEAHGLVMPVQVYPLFESALRDAPAAASRPTPTTSAGSGPASARWPPPTRTRRPPGLHRREIGTPAPTTA